MNGDLVWLATLATVVLLFGYEALVALAQRRRPGRMAHSAHAALRAELHTAAGAASAAADLAVRLAGLLGDGGALPPPCRLHLRHLILVAPTLASLLHPFAWPVAAVLALSGFGRFGS